MIREMMFWEVPKLLQAEVIRSLYADDFLMMTCEYVGSRYEEYVFIALREGERIRMGAYQKTVCKNGHWIVSCAGEGF